ncbi:MAG: hypothetical protein LBL04_01345, partial [Bacteroidales bacterium]|nr:hypothetical protein [Bacteroidales bacterium]
LFDPDRSADPVRSGAAPTPVRNADLSGCAAADRVNVNENVSGGRSVDPDRSGTRCRDAMHRVYNAGSKTKT